MVLNSEFYDFIEKYSGFDINHLKLKFGKTILPFDLDFALTQILCRKKCRTKLSEFISHDSFLFPDETASEQSSHQGIASFHASLVKGSDKGADLTAGLGIDAMSIAGVVNSMVACEIVPRKAEILSHNISVLMYDNIEVYEGDCLSFLNKTESDFDFIFIDPARRDDSNSRVYNLHDCLPDVCGMMPLMLSRAGTVFIKASPLLDVTQTIRDFPDVKGIKAVSVNGECKEILIIVTRQESIRDMDECDGISAEGVDLDNDGNIRSSFKFTIFNNPDSAFNDKETAGTRTSIEYASYEDLKHGSFLYEPNVTIMKLAPWKELQLQYPGIRKMGKSSHLFISEKIYDNFPGRILKILSIPDKKDRKSLKGEPVNVVSRNFPLSAPEIRKKLGVKEGKDKFLYATRIDDKPIMILSKRVSRYEV